MTKERFIAYGRETGAWLGKYLVRCSLTGVALVLLAWLLSDHVPSQVITFILGVVFNDMWNDDSFEKEDET